MTIRHRRHETRLVTDHPFQLGYATTDLEQAIATFADELDAPDFLVRDPMKMEVSGPRGTRTAELQLAFAYIGDITVELIEPIVDDTAIYTQVLPDDGFGLALHHLGFLVAGGLDDWQDFRAGVSDDRLLFEGAVEDHTRYLYVDTSRTLGHHLEYIWWSLERMAWLEDVPRN